jgi:hypothetical protein
MQRFMMVTFGEPKRSLKRNNDAQARKEIFGKTRRKIELYDFDAAKDEDLPQGAKSLNFGGLILP